MTSLPGLYRGICVDNDDPDRLMRIMVQVPQVSGDIRVGWVYPCVAPGTVMGLPYSLRVPPLSGGVWIMYEGGDPHKPIWIGGF